MSSHDAGASLTPGAAPLDRRAFMTSLSALGLGGTALPAALWARSNGGQDAVTPG